MRKLFLISLTSLSLVTAADDIVVSPSSDFQSYLDNLNMTMIGFLDYYLMDYQGYIQYMTDLIGSGQDSLQNQNLEQTQRLQDLIDNIIEYVEPQLEELRLNSTDEIVPDLKSLLQYQEDIATDVNSLDVTLNDGLNDLTIALENINKSREEYYEGNKQHNQQQQEYYSSLEGAVNSLENSLVNEVGPNILGIGNNLEEIRHKMDYLSTEGTSVAILNALVQNGLRLDDIIGSFGSISGGKNNVTNYFPEEILKDYKSIDRGGETLELGWKLSDDADTFQPGSIILSQMDDENVRGGYFEQVLKYLNVNTKVGIESKETLLAILKSIPVESENREKEANDFVSDVEGDNRQAKQDEQSAVDTADGIELKDNDKFKSTLNRQKDIAESLVSSSQGFNDQPSQVFINFRALGQTYNASQDLPATFISVITTIHDVMPWVYGLIIFGTLSSLFFYLLGILYQIITNYKVV